MIRLLTLLMVMVAALAGCATTDQYDEDARLDEAARYNTQLGITYLQKGNLKQADLKLGKAIEQDPNSAEAHHAYAILQERLGNTDAAGEHYSRAVRLDPKYSEAHNNYGRFLCAQGDLRAAEREFEAAVANPLYSNPELAYTNAGICALEANETEDAEQYFRNALGKNPKYLPALFEMAQLAFDKEHYLQARAYIQRYDAVRGEILEGATDARRYHPRILWLCVQTEQQMGDRSAAAACALKLKNFFPQSRETAELLEMERHGRVN